MGWQIRRRQPLRAQCPLPRWRGDGKQGYHPKKQGWKGSLLDTGEMRAKNALPGLLWAESPLTLGMKLIPPSLVLPQDQQSLQSFPKAAEKALTREDGVERAR